MQLETTRPHEWRGLETQNATGEFAARAPARNSTQTQGAIPRRPIERAATAAPPDRVRAPSRRGAPSDLRLQVDVEGGAVLVERRAALDEGVLRVVHARLLRLRVLHRQERRRPVIAVRGLRALGHDGLAERRQRGRRSAEERLRLLGALLGAALAKRRAILVSDVFGVRKTETPLGAPVCA